MGMVVGEMVPHEPKRLLVQTAAELRRGARQQDTCAEISDVRTTRRIERQRGGDVLIQETSFTPVGEEPISFSRRFQREEDLDDP